MSLAIGSPAPEFNLTDQHGAKISLSSFKGSKNVVVLFYPFAFSGTCTGELCGLRDDLAAFQNEDVQFPKKKVITSQFSRTSGHMAQQLRLSVSLTKITVVQYVELSLSIRLVFFAGR